MKDGNKALSHYGTTIFTVMSAMAQEYDAINLGQGFPSDEGPHQIRAVASNELLNGYNQYPPMMGLPKLREAVAEHDKRFYGIPVNWKTDVMITSGATEALSGAILALTNPGDEVVLIEPLYDSYRPIVDLAGATARFITLKEPEWELSEEAVEAAFSAKTKLIIVNTPMNPIGKVFTHDELSMIGRIAEKYDAYILCDEVYEHLVFDDLRHVPLMSDPKYRERCIRIGSAGKTFSLTGWKVGYVTSTAPIIEMLARAHQFLTFTTPPNLQIAVAEGLRSTDLFFDNLKQEMQDRRDLLTYGLQSVGFNVLPCDGTYFLTADFAPLGFSGSDIAFCELITKEAGVAAVPTSAFYANPYDTTLVRFCFCKQTDMLERAIKRLKAYFKT